MTDKKLFTENKENLVFAKGRIIGFGRDDFSHKRFILYVRGSKDRSAAYISFAIGTDMPLDIAVNDTVDVEGHYVSYTPKANSFRSIKTRPIQYFVADKVTKSVTELEKIFGVAGFAHEQSFCRAYFKGKIQSLEPSSNNWINAHIEIPAESEEHRTNSVTAQYTTKMRVNDVGVQEGDTVCMACFVTSKTKERNGKENRYEDFILEDWAVAKPA